MSNDFSINVKNRHFIPVVTFLVAADNDGWRVRPNGHILWITESFDKMLLFLLALSAYLIDIFVYFDALLSKCFIKTIV